MTSREEESALTGLAALMQQDLSGLELEEIAAGVRQARTVRDAVPGWMAALLVELRSRGLSWAEIERETQEKAATAWHQVKYFEQRQQRD